MSVIIGLTGSMLVNNTKTFAGLKRAYINNYYVESVIRAGATPIILPMNDNLETVLEMVKLVDGIIFSGGHDVDPFNYGEEHLLKLGETNPQRDEFDIALYKEAIKLKKPIMGICRGFQLINVINGGTLYQDLSYANFVKLNHDQKDGGERLTHGITVENSKFLQQVTDGKYRVNSFHHQIIKDIAKNLTITAKSDDGVIEAYERINDNEFIVGFQWHPEMLSGVDENAKNIFDKFVKEIENRKNK